MTELPQASDFHSQGYLKLPDLLALDQCRHLYKHCVKSLMSGELEMGDPKQHNGVAPPQRYGDPEIEALLLKLQQKMEQATGLNLIPTYAFYRFYRNQASMVAHRDRSACEISLSLCLGADNGDLEDSYAWPLYCDGTPIGTPVGDAVAYKGCDVLHWREPYPGKWLLQAFLHYVDADGSNARHGYDRRRKLGEAYQPIVGGPSF
ncbi:MAG: hypothetical protein ABJF89_00615 [Parasphingorhabdus sp.]